MEHPASVPPNAFVFSITVQAADIDAQGHVSNVRVLDWMNQAAIAHSDALGFDVPRYREIGGIFVVRRHEIDYHAPSYASEELRLFTWPAGKIRRSLAERRHELWRVDGTRIARGLNHWVFVDTESGRPRAMPPEVIEAFDPAQWRSEEA